MIRMKKCPYCGAQNADDSRFCTECGKEIPQGNVCPHCGASVNEGDAFCQSCGKNLNAIVDEKPVQYEEEEEPKKNMFIPILAVLLLLVMIGGGWWYWDSSKKRVAKEKAISDSLAIVRRDSLDKEKARLDSIELYNRSHSPETILKRVKEMYGEEKFFSTEYHELRSKMDEVAKKSGVDGIYFEDQDYNIWFGGNGGCDGLTSTKYGEVTNISEKTAKIHVSNTNDCDEHYNVILYLVFEDNNWFVDDISNPYLGSFKEEIKQFIEKYSRATSTNNHDEDNTSYSSSTSFQSLSFANEQYVTMHLANKTFKNNTGIDIRIDGSLRMYIDGDYAGVVSVQRYSSTSALIRYGGGAYGEGYMMVNVENGKLKISDTTDGTTWYQK